MSAYLDTQFQFLSNMCEGFISLGTGKEICQGSKFHLAHGNIYSIPLGFWTVDKNQSHGIHLAENPKIQLFFHPIKLVFSDDLWVLKIK